MTNPIDGVTGASLVSLSVESSDHAERLVKKLFSKGMIAQADLSREDQERQFLMHGDLHSTDYKLMAQLTTSDARLPELINFLNQDDTEVKLDYPANDIQVEPITGGNQKYIDWVKE